MATRRPTRSCSASPPWSASREDGNVARYGPDEFLIVQPGPDATRPSRRCVGSALGSRPNRSQFGDSERLPITVSAGDLRLPGARRIVTELLPARPSRWREAKASGGDQVRVAQVGEEERVVSGIFDVLQGLVIAVDTKDRYTKRHSEDVARYAVFLAERIGLDEETSARSISPASCTMSARSAFPT